MRPSPNTARASACWPAAPAWRWTGWSLRDDNDAFAALRALPEADKRTLFAACVARTLKGQLAFEHGARPEFEATAARLGIGFARRVRPTAGLFWSRITKARMLGVARATLGEAWAQARAKLKKADLATYMEDAFAGADAALSGGRRPSARAGAELGHARFPRLRYARSR